MIINHVLALSTSWLTYKVVEYHGSLHQMQPRTMLTQTCGIPSFEPVLQERTFEGSKVRSHGDVVNLRISGVLSWKIITKNVGIMMTVIGDGTSIEPSKRGDKVDKWWLAGYCRGLYNLFLRNTCKANEHNEMGSGYLHGSRLKWINRTNGQWWESFKPKCMLFGFWRF